MCSSDLSAYRFRWRLPRLLMWAIGNIRGVGAEQKPVVRDESWNARKIPETADPYSNEPSTWPWTPEISARKNEGFRLNSARDYVAATKVFEALHAESPRDPQVHQMLATLYSVLGRQQDSARELDWLRAAWRDQPGYWVGNALVQALREIGRWQECIDLSKDFLTRFPQAAEAWSAKAVADWQIGNIDPAVQAIERSIELRFDQIGRAHV